MPTGYTYQVQEGTITSLSDFAMLCSRAFGATIDLRDEPLNAEIPEKFEPSNYHFKEIQRETAVLAAHDALKRDEIVLKTYQTYERDLNYAIEYNKKADETNEKYQNMLNQIDNFQVPESHANFKAFMIEQLNMSMESFRMPMPAKLTPEAWFSKERKRLVESIQYHEKYYAEDVERATKNTEWISTLRQLIKEQS